MITRSALRGVSSWRCFMRSARMPQRYALLCCLPLLPCYDAEAIHAAARYLRHAVAMMLLMLTLSPFSMPLHDTSLMLSFTFFRLRCRFCHFDAADCFAAARLCCLISLFLRFFADAHADFFLLLLPLAFDISLFLSLFCLMPLPILAI